MKMNFELKITKDAYRQMKIIIGLSLKSLNDNYCLYDTNDNLIAHQV